MRPELRKTSYLRNLKAEILKEAGGADLPEDFEDIKTALEDIYGDDDQKDGLIADVSAIQTVMAEEPENGGVIANILDWRTNGVRKDDLKNETFTITGEQGTVEVPAGTGTVVCDGLTDAVTLDLSGDFYPQVILINNAVGGHAVTFEGNTIDAAGTSVFVNFGGNWLSLGDDE